LRLSKSATTLLTSKPYSPQKATLIEDLKHARQSNAHYLEMIRQMKARLQSLELAREENHQNRGRRHHHRNCSRTSHNSHGYHEGTEQRRHHTHEERPQHVATPYLPCVKLPSFSGEGDPNVYFGWEARVDQIFHVHGVVLDDQRVRLASLEFLDYAMQWWHQTLMDIGLNKATCGLLELFKSLLVRYICSSTL